MLAAPGASWPNARVENLGIHQLKITPRSPWQNSYAERFVGTLRRELLDHLIVLGECHLLRAVRTFVAYDNNDRPHMSLGGDAPISRPVESPTTGEDRRPPKGRRTPSPLREGGVMPDEFLAATGP
jgi:transposase InsO family protein